jgi:hypothetical protein
LLGGPAGTFMARIAFWGNLGRWTLITPTYFAENLWNRGALVEPHASFTLTSLPERGPDAGTMDQVRPKRLFVA